MAGIIKPRRGCSWFLVVSSLLAASRRWRIKGSRKAAVRVESSSLSLELPKAEKIWDEG